MERTEILIIGAGVVGSAIAYHLALDGWRVLVVDRAGVADAPGTALAPTCEGPARPVPARMTEGRPTVTSIARGGTHLVRPHQGAVSPNNAIRSAQDRACVHRGALSPEHSR